MSGRSRPSRTHRAVFAAMGALLPLTARADLIDGPAPLLQGDAPSFVLGVVVVAAGVIALVLVRRARQRSGGGDG